MFSSAHLAQFVESYSARVQPQRDGGRVYFCSIEETRYYVKHFEELTKLDKKGKPIKSPRGWVDPECWKRPLTRNEIHFIADQQTFCRHSHLFYIERYHTIRDVRYEGARRLFELNTAQKIMQALVGKFSDAGVSQYIQSLKARQVGISTWSISVMLWKALFANDQILAIASSTDAKSNKLRDDHFLGAMAKVPWWLYDYANVTTHESGSEVLRNDVTQHNVVNLYHGDMKSDLGRGDTTTSGHFSELLEWGSMEEQLFAGLLKAVHPNPSTFIILESTAAGKNNEWHDLWRDNVANYPNGKSYIVPSFLPWFVGAEIYPTPGFLKMIPVPQGYVPMDYVQRHAEQCREYVLQNALLREHLGMDWRMSIEQMWWYEFTFNEHKRKDKLGLFFQETPANPEQAFQSKEGGVFEREVIEVMQSQQGLPISPPLMFQNFGVPTQLIPSEELVISKKNAKDESEYEMLAKWEKQLQYNHLSLGINYTWNISPTRLKQESAGMRWLDCNPDGILWIWENPSPTERYWVSMDAGHGVGRDSTVIQVGKMARGVKGPAQVAEFASNKISASEAYFIYLCLLCMYSFSQKGESAVGLKTNYALSVVEVQANGMEVVNRLINLGWPNIYERRVMGAVGRVSVSRGNYGWETTPKTRRVIVDWVLRLVRGNQTLIRSPWLINELDGLVKLPNNPQREIDHLPGGHDDRVFAYFIGLIAAHWDMIEGVDQLSWTAPQSDTLAKMFENKKKLVTSLPSSFYHSLYSDMPLDTRGRLGAMQAPSSIQSNLAWQPITPMTNSGAGAPGKIPFGVVTNPIMEGGANHKNLSKLLDNPTLGVYTLTNPVNSATLEELSTNEHLRRQREKMMANLISQTEDELKDVFGKEGEVKFNQGTPRLRGRK